MMHAVPRSSYVRPGGMGLGVAAGSGHSAAARRRCLKGSTTVAGNTRGVPMKKLRRSVLAIASLAPGPGSRRTGYRDGGLARQQRRLQRQRRRLARRRVPPRSPRQRLQRRLERQRRRRVPSQAPGRGLQRRLERQQRGWIPQQAPRRGRQQRRLERQQRGWIPQQAPRRRQQRRLERQRRRLVLTFLRCRSWAPDMSVACEVAGWSRPPPAPPGDPTRG